MYNNWCVDLSDSVKALETIKNNELKKILDGEIYSIENSNNEVLILMDKFSGLDYIRKNDKGLQGVAARVQWGKNWQTFTIRFKRHTGTETELEKRLSQIDNGYIYPAFTLQAYFNARNENKLLGMAIVKTKFLYSLYLEKPNLFYEKKSDNLFLCINWNDIIKENKEIIRVYNS